MGDVDFLRALLAFFLAIRVGWELVFTFSHSPAAWYIRRADWGQPTDPDGASARVSSLICAALWAYGAWVMWP